MSDQGFKHQTHINSDIYGPVHTGSGSINIYYQDQDIKLSKQEEEALLTDYASWQKKNYKYLPLSGIPLPLEVDVQLDKIYIKLRALPQKKQSEDATSIKYGVTLDDALNFVRSFGELQWQRYQESDPSSILALRLSEEPIMPEQAISNHNNIVIIGTPGSGKSTLLRHLVWEQANDSRFPIPLLISLGRVDMLMGQHHLSFLEAALDVLTAHVVDVARIRLRRALISAIESKRVRFLFDGLDEVHACKQQIVEALTALATNENRLVVTSRPIGYERLVGFEHYEILPLLPEDAYAFALRWFRYLAEAHGLELEKQLEWSIERGEWLKGQLEDRPSLREIARIPLLLTFLAILAGDEPKEGLPHFRKDLYSKYVEQLFTTWESKRKRYNLDEQAGKKLQTLTLWGLYHIAYKLHLTYYGNQSKEQPTPQMVKMLLAKEICRRWNFDELDAVVHSEAILNFWEQAGLLIKYRMQEQEILAFRHLTFQEYGAARSLAEAEPEKLWDILKQYMDNPQWSELIPLTLAHLSQDECTKLFDKMLNADLKADTWHRPLLLTANALADGARPLEFVQRTVINRLIDLVLTLPRWTPDKASATAIYNVLAKQEGNVYCFNSLLTIAKNEYEDLLDRILAAEAAGRIDKTGEAIAILHSILKIKELDLSLKLWIARIFARFGKKEEAVEMLKPLTTPRSQPITRGIVAEIFAELDQVEQATIILSELANDSHLGSAVRVEAIRGLRRLHQIEPVISLGLNLARDESLDNLARIQLTELLGELGLTEESRQILENIVQDAQTTSLEKIEAIESLSHIVNLNQSGSILQYFSTIYSIIKNSEIDLDVRTRALQVLSQFSQVTELVDILTFIACNREEEVSLRYKACKSLISIGQRAQGEKLSQTISQETGSMSLLEHLTDLGKCISWAVFAEFIAFGLVALIFSPIIVPALSFIYFHLRDKAFVETLLSFRLITIIEGAFMLALPIQVYQIYLYIKPGLIDVEKSRVPRYIFTNLSLFLIYIPSSRLVLSYLFVSINLNFEPFWFLFFVNELSFIIFFVIMYFILKKKMGPYIKEIEEIITFLKLKVNVLSMVFNFLPGLILGFFTIIYSLFINIGKTPRKATRILIKVISFLFSLSLLIFPLNMIVIFIESMLIIIILLTFWFKLTSFINRIPTRERFAIIYLSFLNNFKSLLSPNKLNRVLLNQLLFREIIEFDSAHQALNQLKKEVVLPAEASWSLVNVEETINQRNSSKNSKKDNYEEKWENIYELLFTSLTDLEIVSSLNNVLSIARNPGRKPAIRIRAAHLVGEWTHQGEMASIIAQISIEENVKLQNDNIKVLRQWNQVHKYLHKLQNLAMNEQAPLKKRIWAIKTFTKVASREQTSQFIDALIDDPLLNSDVYQLLQMMKKEP